MDATMTGICSMFLADPIIEQNRNNARAGGIRPGPNPAAPQAGRTPIQAARPDHSGADHGPTNFLCEGQRN
jgi:hypothetical protein